MIGSVLGLQYPRSILMREVSRDFAQTLQNIVRTCRVTSLSSIIISFVRKSAPIVALY